MLYFFGEVKGQTPTYLTGQVTGRKFEAGSFLSLGTGNAGITGPMLTHAWGCLLGAQTNQFRFYYNTAANFSAGAPATVTAARSLGLLGALGAGGDSYIQFRNTGNATIAAGTPTYFRLNSRPTSGGISLNVGGVLGLTELQSITGQAYSGASDYTLNTATVGPLTNCGTYNGNENPGTVAGTSTTKILIDASGNWFAKVTPSVAYNSVRLNVAYPEDKLLLLDLAALANLNASVNVNVHSAFTQTDGGPCNLSPQFASPGEIVSGIVLSTAQATAGLGINLSQLVSNPQYAINGNTGDFTSFTTGLASIGAVSSVAQSYYFDHSSTVNDGIRVQLGVQQSLIDLALLGTNTIRFKAYNGTNTSPVYEKTLAEVTNLLQLNLLNLVTINGSTHKRLDLTLKPDPGVVFDRFEIVFEQGLANVGVLGDALRIYEVSMAPYLPTITIHPTNGNSTNNVCEGSNATFSVTATAPVGGVISGYQWQYFDSTNGWVDQPLATSNTLTLTSVTNAMNNRWYRAKITGGNALTSCRQDIYSYEVKLTVNPLPSITLGSNPTVCQGVTNCTLPFTATTASPTTYSITWSSGLISNVPETTLPATPISITIPNNLTPATYTGTITVKNANSCTSAPVNFTLTVNPLQTAPSITVN